MSALLDTHAAIWYVFIHKRLSADALKFIRRSIDRGKPVYISAISIVETIYLVEKGSVPFDALRRLREALKDPMSGLVVEPIDEEIAETVQGISRSAVPELPDRIIAATALHLGIPLITRDERLQASGIKTIW